MFECLSTGVDCQVLTPGRHWRKGKMKVVIVFEEDPEEAIAPTEQN
ncbi:MAG: hypothetical protein F6K47_03465 [Symploca sp. SIO2E6]|nr:hypothetical protein [Symploca sp. SIO2E6]